jgi:hypothetical protein
MSALRQRDIIGGPALPDAVGSVLDQLAASALAIPPGQGSIAELSRARLLRKARIAGARCRMDGADIITLVSDFQACRAGLRRRRGLQAYAPSVARSADWNLRADALLDDVLVAIVRGYEGRLELQPASTPPDGTSPAHRRARAHPLGSSKRE